MRRLSSIPRDVRSEIRIGTSGWSYDAWRGPLYPAKLPKKNWLRYYATQFSSAEINSSFYRTPTLAAVKSWQPGYAERLQIFLEGLEIYDSLEAASADMREFDCLDADAPPGAWAEGGRGAVSATAPFSQRYRTTS